MRIVRGRATTATRARSPVSFARAGCPVVVGTTGWYHERDAVERDVLLANGAMLWDPNFALGVNLYWQVAELAARLAGRRLWVARPFSRLLCQPQR